MKFAEMKSTRKGTIAEEYVDNYLIQKGYQTWMNTNKQSTIFDGFATKLNKRYLLEIKCKTTTPSGSISIHENDLIKYKKAEIDENRQMLIFILDYKTKKLYGMTIQDIEKNTIMKAKDWDDNKTLIYFNGWKVIKNVEQEVINKINDINNEK